jgi:hypothetical protein
MGGNTGKTKTRHWNAGRRPANKGQPMTAETVTAEEAHRLLRAVRGGATGARNRALGSAIHEEDARPAPQADATRGA